jgi:hypothetical protein
MQFSSLPINSSLQNNPRYQFSLKSESIEILPILSAVIVKMAAIRMQFSSLPINSWLQYNPRYQFSLKSENIEILPILSAAIFNMAAIRSRFFLVRIFYQPYLIYLPSLVEIPLVVSDIGEVTDFYICSRFTWQRWPLWKFQDLSAPLEIGIHLSVKFSKDWIISLWELGQTSSRIVEEEEE